MIHRDLGSAQAHAIVLFAARSAAAMASVYVLMRLTVVYFQMR